MMRLKTCGFFVTAAVLAMGNSARAAEHALQDDATAFGAREAATSMDLSPSGTKIVLLVPAAGAATQAKVFDLATGQSTVALSTSGRPDTLSWCNFASETQLVCSYTGTGNYGSSLVGFSRLITLKTDGSNIKALGQSSSWFDASLRQFDGAIIDWLPDEQGSVLMARDYVAEEGKIDSLVKRDKSGLGVDRVTLSPLSFKPIEGAKPLIDRYTTDGHGNVRLMAGSRHGPTGQLTGVTDYHYRRAGQREWLQFGSYDSRNQTGYYPLAIDSESDGLFALKRLNGRDALYKVKLDGSLAASLVASDASVDIDSVIRAGHGQRVVGYSFADTRRRAVYFDPEFDRIAVSLGKATAQPQIDFIGASRDGSKLLLLASADINPGRYYVFDRTSKHLNETALVRPELEHRTLAPVKPVTYASSDGTSIPAYLTLPASSAGKNLPTVILPHGGPAARDEWGFDWLAQFLAARGYAVLQPEYRGSAGYGQDFQNESAFRNWKTAIGDIDAGARFLAAQGIADPKRVAILGWSYGGYAALQAAATDPALYKAVIAIAPVTDLSLLRFQSSFFTNGQLTADSLGSGRSAADGSPVRNASRFAAPVMLFHGDQDANVGILHSEKMASALRGAAKPVDLQTFKGLDHQLNDSAARIDMLTRIGAFLDANIGH